MCFVFFVSAPGGGPEFAERCRSPTARLHQEHDLERGHALCAMCLRLHDRSGISNDIMLMHLPTLQEAKRSHFQGLAAGVQHSRPDAGITIVMRASSNVTFQLTSRLV